MSAPQATRNTILQSIYCLRRRKSVVPLSNLTNLQHGGQRGSQQATSRPKSLVQGHAQKTVRSSMSATCSTTRNNILSPTRRPTLLHHHGISYPHVQQSHQNGVREHYAASHEISHYDLYPTGNNIEHDHEHSHSHSQAAQEEADNSTISSSPRESDLIVVLDLDECLIHSQFLSADEDNESYEEIYRQQEHRPQSNNPFRHDEEPSSIIPSACESFHIDLPDGDIVRVNKRPNLDEFLKELTSKHETHIFTAAMEVYASPLLDRLDPDGSMFHKRYYRDQCTYDPSLGVYVKDLKQTVKAKAASYNNSNSELKDLVSSSYNGARVVLVDNNPMSFLANPMNGILVSNFYDDPKDDTLQAVLDLLNDLEGEDDVRPVLDEKFGLKDALKEAVQSTHSASWK